MIVMMKWGCGPTHWLYCDHVSHATESHKRNMIVMLCYVMLPLDCVFSSLSGISLDSNVRYPCGSLMISLSAALSIDFSAEYGCFDWTLHWTD